MNLKNDLKLVFQPKNFSLFDQAVDFKSGLKVMGVWGLFLLAVNVLFSLLNGVIGGKMLGKLFGFSLLVSIAATAVIIISLLIVSVVGGYFSKLFKGTGDIKKSVVGMSYVMVLLFLVGVVQNLVLFVNAVGANFSLTVLRVIYFILMLVSFLWMAWISTEGLAWANTIKKWQGLVCFLAGFILVGLINWLLVGWLSEVLTIIFTGIGVF